MRGNHWSAASCMHPTGDWAWNLGMCPYWEVNRDLLVQRSMLYHWATHAWLNLNILCAHLKIFLNTNSKRQTNENWFINSNWDPKSTVTTQLKNNLAFNLEMLDLPTYNEYTFSFTNKLFWVIEILHMTSLSFFFLNDL